VRDLGQRTADTGEGGAPRLRGPGRAAALGLLGFALSHSLTAQAQTQGRAELVADGLDAPVYVAAPAGDPRLFVALRGGEIRIVADGELRAGPFLDLSARVEGAGEGGLLGMAFAPDYAQTGVFYLYYTADGGSDSAVALESRLSRFVVSGDPSVSDTADPTSEEILFAVAQPAANHNGGTIAIREGWLYLGLGDGGGGGDPDDAAQGDGTPLGKMLRFDLAQEGVPWQPETWAEGLRNPFRWSFDRATGDLYIGDVGQGRREEITVEPATSPGGSNFGWDVLEGSACFADPDGGPDPGEPVCGDPSLLLPTFEYGTGLPLEPGPPRSVTGGAVYRGAASPSLQGLYFFADFFADRLWTFRWNPATGEAEDFADRTEAFPPDDGVPLSSIVAIGEDGFGELYAVSLEGSVHRLVPEPEAAALAVAAVLTLAALSSRRRRRVARRRARAHRDARDTAALEASRRSLRAVRPRLLLRLLAATQAEAHPGGQSDGGQAVPGDRVVDVVDGAGGLGDAASGPRRGAGLRLALQEHRGQGVGDLGLQGGGVSGPVGIEAHPLHPAPLGTAGLHGLHGQGEDPAHDLHGAFRLSALQRLGQGRVGCPAPVHHHGEAVRCAEGGQDSRTLAALPGHPHHHDGLVVVVAAPGPRPPSRCGLRIREDLRER